LLSDELLQIKRPLERERMDMLPAVKEEKPEANDTIDSIGSLYVIHITCVIWETFPPIFLITLYARSISHGGRSTFYGQTANSWVSACCKPCISH
jgi:hypothetical protein